MAKTRVVEARPRNSAYTGMLAISLLVMVIVSALMAYDADQLGDAPKTKLQVNVPGQAGGKAGVPK